MQDDYSEIPSFTRTIPIWCCTINSTLLEYKKSKNISLDGWNTDLHLPSWVSESEKSQVQALINGFATVNNISTPK